MQPSQFLPAGSDCDLLIPDNIPVVNYEQLSEEEALMFFITPKELYLDGLKTIVRCNK